MRIISLKSHDLDGYRDSLSIFDKPIYRVQYNGTDWQSPIIEVQAPSYLEFLLSVILFNIVNGSEGLVLSFVDSPDLVASMNLCVNIKHELWYSLKMDYADNSI